MKNRPSYESRSADDLSVGHVLPETIDGPISPRTVFSQMIAGEVRSGRYSRAVHRKLLKLAEELGLRRADAEEIISRCCQEYAQTSVCKQRINSHRVSKTDLAFRRLLARALVILVLAALVESLVAYWRF